jgi:hypothetical protein
MNINLERHRLLKILVDQHYKFEAGKLEMPGVPYATIYEKLKCSHSELLKITSLLLIENEIGNYDNAFLGYYSTTKGNAAYADKKYYLIYHRKVLDRVKNFVQIVIPILSLLVAILALTLKIDVANKKLENRIEVLENKIKLHQRESKK